MGASKNQGEGNWAYIVRMHKENTVVAVVADILIIPALVWGVYKLGQWVVKSVKGLFKGKR